MSNDNNIALIKYINNLNLKKYFLISENEYKINENYYITIEYDRNVFFIDHTKKLHKDVFTNIKTIKQLKEVYKLKIGSDIEILMRKEKLKKLCLNQETN